MALIDTLRAAAAETGLDAIGVCDSGPFPEVRDEIGRRVDQGHQAAGTDLQPLQLETFLVPAALVAPRRRKAAWSARHHAW